MGLCVLPELSLGIVIACLPTFPKFFKSLHKPVILTKISEFLFNLFRFRTSGPNRHSIAISTPAKKEPSLRITSRLDTYNRLSEGREMQKQGSNSTMNEEALFEGMGPMMGGKILRTTHVTSVSMPQRNETFSLEDTPWDGNPYYHASVGRGSSCE